LNISPTRRTASRWTNGAIGVQLVRPDPRDSESGDAGTGLHPTEGGLHPTFTMYALALRGVEQLVASWGSIVSA
jgi:hypothetical protein